MKKGISYYWAVIFVSLTLVLILFPIAWVLYISLTEGLNSISFSQLLQSKFTLSNYGKLWENELFKSTFFNSIIVTVFGVVLSLLLGIPVAYYLSFQRNISKLKQLRYFDLWLLLTYMLPEFFFIIPMYILYLKIGLYDTYFGLALLYQVHVLPFSIWMMKNYFQSNNDRFAMMEAALIDGATHWGILTKICIPISKSGIAAITILNAIWIWNELAIALNLSFSRAQTVTVGITSFRGYASIDYGAMAGASLIAILPMLIGSIFIQKHIIKGLAAGAVK